MKKVVVASLVVGSVLMASDGAELYKKCAACHGAQGQMKALNKSEVIKGQEKAKLVESMKGYKAGTLNKNGSGALMKAQVAAYSDADIEALAEYITTLK